MTQHRSTWRSLVKLPMRASASPRPKYPKSSPAGKDGRVREETGTDGGEGKWEKEKGGAMTPVPPSCIVSAKVWTWEVPCANCNQHGNYNHNHNRNPNLTPTCMGSRYFISLTHGNRTPGKEQIRTQVTSLRGPILMQEDFLGLITKSRHWSSSFMIIVPVLIAICTHLKTFLFRRTYYT